MDTGTETQVPVLRGMWRQNLPRSKLHRAHHTPTIRNVEQHFSITPAVGRLDSSGEFDDAQRGKAGNVRRARQGWADGAGAGTHKHLGICSKRGAPIYKSNASVHRRHATPNHLGVYRRRCPATACSQSCMIHWTETRAMSSFSNGSSSAGSERDTRVTKWNLGDFLRTSLED